MTVPLSEISVSSCETYHLKGKSLLYGRTFLKVLKYHEPGFAPVLGDDGAYHINLDGTPAYEYRFKRTFGFYNNKAGVESSEGWFHIHADGTAVYSERYAWVGNFQEEICTVRDFKGSYFHIDKKGIPLYPDRYAYVGDFKDGIAIICDEQEGHTHIDREGRFIHSKRFRQLDIFHKGFARAKDDRGWGHINKTGDFIYEARYVSIEPFYNGLAYAEDNNERLLLINEVGEIIKIIRDVHNHSNDLSADMVGFWKTWTLYAGISLKIPDALPADLKQISERTNISPSKLKRLLRALWELDVVRPVDFETWELTEKGNLLKPIETSFLAAAGLMWGKVNKVWENLPALLQTADEIHHPSFKEEETDDNWIKIYNRALDGYAEKDFKNIADFPFWKDHTFLLGFGRCSLTILPLLLGRYDHLKVLESTESLKKADAILFPRFLHYFPDEEGIFRLKNSKKQLTQKGAIYIFEMFLENDTPMGGLFDLNMLAETGGKVRSLEEWQDLLLSSGFELTDVHKISPALSVLKGIAL
ncbi:MAG: WG repeat-containing protein [Alphaproteobacteria bacterium]|nr:WG repeat-containing protein [Alphaproteobacteria bacterium]